MAITCAQKQALIDNLQLEITERARKLRAQYALQAQGVRTRIEIRVNRIPMAMRKMKMGELLAKCASEEDSNEKDSPAESQKRPASTKSQVKDDSSPKARTAERAQKALQHSSPVHTRGLKRSSASLDTNTGKDDDIHHDLSIPKKRTKTTTTKTAAAKAPPMTATNTTKPTSSRATGAKKKTASTAPTRATTRAASRTTSRAKVDPSQILSPKSSNSRQFPPSPVRPQMSPLKPALALVEKAKVTRVPSTKKANATTATGATKRKTPAALAPGGRKAAAAKDGGAPSTTTRRVLRKRN
ncbi:MAG: hypothetical protein M1817_000692 [Caeruleum heppii]|nr:MAG: hypothetical protein M1817_000692 [Caeruleum heppii]